MLWRRPLCRRVVICAAALLLAVGCSEHVDPGDEPPLVDFSRNLGSGEVAPGVIRHLGPLLHVSYSEALDPGTFSARIDGEDITARFQPTPGARQAVSMKDFVARDSRHEVVITAAPAGGELREYQYSFGYDPPRTAIRAERVTTRVDPETGEEITEREVVDMREVEPELGEVDERVIHEEDEVVPEKSPELQRAIEDYERRVRELHERSGQ